MELSSLTAIAPIDGRYRSKVSQIAPYFSEFGLIRYRVYVEIEYFIALCKIPLPQLNEINPAIFPKLRSVYENFQLKDAQSIKEIESTTNHDVKAVEYFLKKVFENLELTAFKEFIHFGLTSQDINNTATPLSLKKAFENEYVPVLSQLQEKLEELSSAWQDVPLLARTHGQPASPTLLGKEFQVFIERLTAQIQLLERIPFTAKFGGATGNFNAHIVAYSNIDWVQFANDFVENTLQLKRSHYTTQIAHYDNLGAFFDAIKRINTILLDFCRDIWTYISMDYFKQKIKKGEVGSSTMPHKVNPIDFENAEGNLGIANALLEHLSSKLPISRLQRDLTDSTVLRNIGVPMAHTLIAFQSILKGLNKLLLNKNALHADLNNNWAVVTEAIQTILRRESYPNPYEALKALSRTNERITEASIHAFITELGVSETVKEELRLITPFNYTGVKL